MITKRKTHQCPICGSEFVKYRSTQKVCVSVECALSYARKQNELKEQKARLTKEKTERRIFRKRKADAKPLSHWKDYTGRVVNDYVRLRDADEPCISCGTFDAYEWHAGHYRSVGAASHLRFNLLNIHKQCHRCNCHLSSNAITYRINLIKKIGEERVLALENDNDPHRFTREELDDIRKEVRAMHRALLKERASA